MVQGNGRAGRSWRWWVGGSVAVAGLTGGAAVLWVHTPDLYKPGASGRAHAITSTRIGVLTAGAAALLAVARGLAGRIWWRRLGSAGVVAGFASCIALVWVHAPYLYAPGDPGRLQAVALTRTGVLTAGTALLALAGVLTNLLETSGPRTSATPASCPSGRCSESASWHAIGKSYSPFRMISTTIKGVP
jgi:hypothetical protein